MAATLVAEGRVLLSGGYNAQTAAIVRSVRVYDPVADSLQQYLGLNTARGWHTATVLMDGRVLIAGGDDNTSHDTTSVEIGNRADR